MSFLAGIPAESTAIYYLKDDGKDRVPDSPLGVTKTDTEIQIDTGPASFTVPLTGEALLSAARVKGNDVLGAAGLRGVILTGEWPERGLKTGDRMVTWHQSSDVTVEESGPARVVVCIRGRHVPGDKEGKLYMFTARLIFAANDATVRILYSLNNTKLDPTLYPSEKGKSRFAYVWPIQDLSLVAELVLGEKARVSTLGDSEIVSAEVTGEPLVVYQRDLDHFVVRVSNKEQASGTENSGVLDVTGTQAGLAVARRYFASEWPGVLAGSTAEVRIGLLPKESGEKFHFNIGQRKSWDLRLRFHDGTPTDLKRLAAEKETLLLFRPQPAWMVRAAGIAGSWSAGLHLGPPPAVIPLRRTPGKLERPARREGDTRPFSRWDFFGVTRAWNAGGGHWNEESAFEKWLIWGDGAEFDSNEVRTLWATDLSPIQYENPDLGAFGAYIYYMRFPMSRLEVLTYPGYVNRHLEYPDTGHMGMWMWHQYYLLTGDARAREATCNLGNYARAYFWRHTHDGRTDGTGPEPGTSGFRKKNPDAEPEFKLERRYDGWPLYCLAQYYQLTGDPELLAECRIVARAFRNTARVSPIGQMVRDAASKTGTDSDDLRTHAREYVTALRKGYSGTASQYRECTNSASKCCSNFYIGYIMTALREYFTYSRDVEALDTLVGQSDHFCRHILIRNPEGKPVGWSYIFCDYWGPYTWEDATGDVTRYGADVKYKSGPSLLGPNVCVSDPLGAIYYLTGKPEVFEVVKAACEAVTPALAASGYDKRSNCMFMALRHPKVDQTAPGAITDLRAEPLGDGKVRLTWTAPGNDGEKGRAAWYHVKWSPAPIVELTNGWPDRTEPLPATNKEWHERAAAFNARQRTFWAAFNLPGEPVPAVAGTTQNMTAENIPTGKVYFAIKTWDAANNVSPLSNVVELTVK
ncbi:MAG: exo-rhamnogalacturonan lyase family protein [Kiritimatiellia bacterium]